MMCRAKGPPAMSQRASRDCHDRDTDQSPLTLAANSAQPRQSLQCCTGCTLPPRLPYHNGHSSYAVGPSVMFHLRDVYPVFHPNALTPFAVNLKHGRHVGRFSTTEKDTAGLYVKRQRSTGLPEGCAGPGINTSSFPVHTSVVLSTSIVSNSTLVLLSLSSLWRSLDSRLS